MQTPERKAESTLMRDQRTATRAWGAMRRAPAWAAAVMLVACAGVAHASSNPNLPDWVMQAAAETGSWGDAKAAILLNDTLLTVGPDGKAVERTRMVVKILRPQGRRAA